MLLLSINQAPVILIQLELVFHVWFLFIILRSRFWLDRWIFESSSSFFFFLLGFPQMQRNRCLWADVSFPGYTLRILPSWYQVNFELSAGLQNTRYGLDGVFSGKLFHVVNLKRSARLTALTWQNASFVLICTVVIFPEVIFNFYIVVSH